MAMLFANDAERTSYAETRMRGGRNGEDAGVKGSAVLLAANGVFTALSGSERVGAIANQWKSQQAQTPLQSSGATGAE